MPSANQTIGTNGSEFLVDGTARTNTCRKAGGYIYNSGTVTFYVNFEAATPTVTQPGGASNILVPVGKSVPVPLGCNSYQIKSTAGDTYAQHVYGGPIG
jgi:hypothetical protein